METTAPHIQIRLSTRSDSDALVRLAALDSAPAPLGSVLVAEVDGEVVAARSLGSNGRTISDPFSATEYARELLELRATQLPSSISPMTSHPRRRHPLLRRRAVRSPIAA
jgi:hypothetical protein